MRRLHMRLVIQSVVEQKNTVRPCFAPPSQCVPLHVFNPLSAMAVKLLRIFAILEQTDVWLKIVSDMSPTTP
jgi:hypothetical protein